VQFFSAIDRQPEGEAISEEFIDSTRRRGKGKTMVTQIGRSTDPSTATHRDDVGGREVASFRYNNPGSQYPTKEAALFGQTGFGIIGGGEKIARFPSPVNGAVRTSISSRANT
jgi:hypothetical protein